MFNSENSHNWFLQAHLLHVEQRKKNRRNKLTVILFVSTSMSHSMLQHAAAESGVEKVNQSLSIAKQ